jgi:hypothetical protein
LDIACRSLARSVERAALAARDLGAPRLRREAEDATSPNHWKSFRMSWLFWLAIDKD